MIRLAVRSDFQQHLIRRLEASGVGVPDDGRLRWHEVYLGLLSKWNRTINLTSLRLDPLSDEAIDRLLVEPIAAAQFAGPAATVIDFGSGGGSPAIPFWIQLPGAHITMIESRSRKCAFLREAVRQISPGRGAALDVRFEDVLERHPGLVQSADIVTLRAVKLDRAMFDLVNSVEKADGLVFRWTSTEEAGLPPGVAAKATHPLTRGTNSILQII